MIFFLNGYHPHFFIVIPVSLQNNFNLLFLETVRGYRILWTGMGAQLARDVPYSAICWATLEPVRIHSLIVLSAWVLLESNGFILNRSGEAF